MNKMSNYDESNYFGDLRTVVLCETTLGLALEGRIGNLHWTIATESLQGMRLGPLRKSPGGLISQAFGETLIVFKERSDVISFYLSL